MIIQDCLTGRGTLRMVTKIRPFRVCDLLGLNRMYDSLSEESRNFFDPRFLGFKNARSNIIQWVFAQSILVASSSNILGKIMHVIDRTNEIFLAVVAVGKYNDLVGFGYLWGRKSKAILGIGVKDSYQGKGIGSCLLSRLVDLGRKEHIKRISLTVRTDNVRALHLYEKTGFKKVKILENMDALRMIRNRRVEMSLDL